MIQAHRPHQLAETVYGELERKRREKWVLRRRNKGVTGLTIHDAPERRESRDGTWIEPCADCGRFLFDLDENLERFCAWCAGNVSYFTKRERDTDKYLRAVRRAAG